MGIGDGVPPCPRQIGDGVHGDMDGPPVPIRGRALIFFDKTARRRPLRPALSDRLPVNRLFFFGILSPQIVTKL